MPKKSHKMLQLLVGLIKLTKKLSDKIPYRRTVWVKNFAKTVTTTTLVSSGIGLLITGMHNGMTNSGFKYIELQVGVICLVIAIIIVTIIDRWAEKKKKEELDIIDKEIDERAEKIAEELVLKHLEEIENENM